MGRGNRPPRTREAWPGGVPLGRALELPPRTFHEDLYQAVRRLDEVHGDGDLPSVPVLMRPGLPVRGRFVVRDGTPSAILLRSDIPHRGFALLHEVGHFVDFSALGSGHAFGSAEDGSVVAVWRRAYRLSQGYQRLSEALSRVIAALQQGKSEDRRRLERLVDPVEVWARAYAQYVTTRSSDAGLLADLDAARTPEPGRLSHVLPWDNDNFDDIATAIDEVFEQRGWRFSTTN